MPHLVFNDSSDFLNPEFGQRLDKELSCIPKDSPSVSSSSDSDSDEDTNQKDTIPSVYLRHQTADSDLTEPYNNLDHPSLRLLCRGDTRSLELPEADSPSVSPRGPISLSPRPSLTLNPRLSPRSSIINELDDEMNNRVRSSKLKGLSLPRSLSPNPDPMPKKEMPKKVCFQGPAEKQKVTKTGSLDSPSQKDLRYSSSSMITNLFPTVKHAVTSGNCPVAFFYKQLSMCKLKWFSPSKIITNSRLHVDCDKS
jgi:hypothetical protein